MLNDAELEVVASDLESDRVERKSSINDSDKIHQAICAFANEAMKALGYVQRFGIGIPTARRQAANNGNPPVEFRVESTSVLAILKR